MNIDHRRFEMWLSYFGSMLTTVRAHGHAMRYTNCLHDVALPMTGDIIVGHEIISGLRESDQGSLYPRRWVDLAAESMRQGDNHTLAFCAGLALRKAGTAGLGRGSEFRECTLNRGYAVFILACWKSTRYSIYKIKS
jgi:hypothetical protein